MPLGLILGLYDKFTKTQTTHRTVTPQTITIDWERLKNGKETITADKITRRRGKIRIQTVDGFKLWPFNGRLLTPTYQTEKVIYPQTSTTTKIKDVPQETEVYEVTIKYRRAALTGRWIPSKVVGHAKQQENKQ